MSDWKEIKASEYCQNVTDGTHDSPKPQKTGKPLVTSKHIKNNNLDISEAYLISEEEFDKIIKRSYVSQWDVIISMIGAYCGFCYLQSSNFTEYAIKNVGLFKIGNEIKSKWLYYYLNSPQGKEQLFKLRRGSSQPYLSLDSLRNILIPQPPSYYQTKIVEILSSMDEKIETNRKINARLEELAQAIFKSWFIDFEPFGGHMPEDWELGKLSDILIINYGKDHKKLSDGDIPVYGSGGIMRYVDSSLYARESVLIPRKGSLNNIMYVDEPFWSVDTMFFTEMKKQHIGKYVYFSLKRINLDNLNSGSAIPSMTTKILNELRIILPTSEILKSFENSIHPIYIKIKNLSKESARLSELRDALLPKLMSGEIKV